MLIQTHPIINLPLDYNFLNGGIINTPRSKRKISFPLDRVQSSVQNPIRFEKSRHRSDFPHQIFARG